MPRLHAAMAGKLPVRGGERRGALAELCRGMEPAGVVLAGLPVRSAGLADADASKARAKQHEACCGYCEELFGYESLSRQ